MKKMLFFITIGIGMYIVFAVMVISTMSMILGEDNLASSDEEGDVRVSLNYDPDENTEENFVGSNLEKQVDVLGGDEVQEKGEPTESATIAQSTTPPADPKPNPTPTIPPPTNGSCPLSTLNCVPCKVSDNHWACRYEAGAEYGYLGWSCQNNNPGNIRPSNFRNTIISNNGGPLPCGKRVDPLRGEYMIFSTYNDGRNAMKAYIKGINNGQHSAYAGCGNCTLRYFLGKWSTNTTTYPDGIGAKMGVNPDNVTLSWVVSNKLDSLVDAMQAQEGFFTM